MKSSPSPDSLLHVRGESLFIDDLPPAENQLYAAVVVSPVAAGKIRSLDTAAARQYPGVHGVFTAADIPGENQVVFRRVGTSVDGLRYRGPIQLYGKIARQSNGKVIDGPGNNSAVPP
jgi:xanthine dehydrogenase molybdopterin-binding subunit B